MRYLLSIISVVLCFRCHAVVIVNGGTWNPTYLPGYYIATNGLATGDGSALNPWSLTAGLLSNTNSANSNHVVLPGSTIWLRGGTYGVGSNTVYSSYLEGSSNAPIVVRQYPGEIAKIDGGLYALGQYTTFWGFEIMNSNTRRLTTSDDRPFGLNLGGLGLKAINLVIHDTGHPGIGFWKACGDPGELYGCIIWGTGLYQTDGGGGGAVRGAAIYTQNDAGGSRLISDTISFKNYTEGVKPYAETAYVHGYVVEGGISFLNYMGGIVVDCTHNAIDTLTISNNYAFNDGTQLIGETIVLLDPGSGGNHQVLNMSGNYMVSDSPSGYWNIVYNRGWSYVTMTNNVFAQITTNTIDIPTGWRNSDVFWNYSRTNVVSYDINRNSYYGGSETVGGNLYVDGARKSFATIQGTYGWEAAGTFTENAFPTANVHFLRPNKYELGRAHLVVYNWETNATESVNISTIGLVNGQTYYVRDVQNLRGAPVLVGTYNDAAPAISVPLTNTAYTPLIGTQTHFRSDPDVHTPTLFNAFVITTE